MLAIILGILLTFLGASKVEQDVTIVPPHAMAVAGLDIHVYEDAYDDAWCEFTNLFNATEVKWSKNGRLMIKPVGATSFKFAKRS